MWMNRHKRFLVGIFTVSGFFLLIGSMNAQAEEKLAVFVSIAPQKYFVHQVGRERVDVQIMVPPGASPATYEPKPRQMAALAKTPVYFAIGVPFEKYWLKKIAAANPNMQVVQTDQGIQKIPMATHHHEAEHNGDKDHQHRGEPDPHIWLSPPLVMIQARTIRDVLQEIDPAHRSLYANNYKAFISKLKDLDVEFRNMFVDMQGLQFMVFHPSWGYFARTYGLKQVAVEIEGKDPKPAQLKALIEHAKNSGIKIIFVQPQFSSKSAKLVAKEIGGRVVVADPLAQDWPGNLRKVVREIEGALQ
jgi:zinc transport system substrate-binding protein